MKWVHTVNDIILKHWSAIANSTLNSYQIRHLHNISKCHTPALGGVLIQCKECDHHQYQYHSCRNRHCPSCQGSKREQWIERQQKYLLDVPYFHVVFTLPHQIRPLCLSHPRLIYNLLFKANWKAIDTLSRDPKHLGAAAGMTAVLHTWSQNLSLHPHLHCIIPGGGVTENNKWKPTRSNGHYLFPKKALAQVFKGIFLKLLKDLAHQGFIALDSKLKEELYSKKWVVYAKRPFNKPLHVIEYLGRYTHKIAISNYRLTKVTESHVSFHWKDYRQAAQQKEMTLHASEFIRRFALHILPHRFVRIRHFGILSFHGRSKVIPIIQASRNFTPTVENIVEPQKKTELQSCQACNSLKLKTIILPRQNRAP